MASKIIIQQTSESDSRLPPNSASSSQSTITAGGDHSSAGVQRQRIVKTSSGTQIYLSGVQTNSRPSNVSHKRSLTPDYLGQPPSKIKLTYSKSNTNVPIVTSVPIQPEIVNINADRMTIRADGDKSPHSVIHVGNNQALKDNVRRLVLSPVKSTGKITMLPLNSSNQVKPGANASKLLNMGRHMSLNSLGAPNSSFQPQTLTLSPQKLVLKGQDNTMHNVVLQQKNTPGLSTALTSLNSSSSNLQPVTVAGSKFQYVRLVSGNNFQAVQKPITLQTSTSHQKPLLAPAVTLQQKMPVASSSYIKATPKSSHSSSQRLILPATSQVPIRPNLGASQYSHHLNSSMSAGGQALTNLPPGTAIISSGQNLQGVQGFALVPAQYVAQLQQQYTPSQPALKPITQQSRNSALRLDGMGSITTTVKASANVGRNQGSSQGAPEGASAASRPRKPCNCTKSQCLKLYCECFANGEFCFNCNCNNCFNNLDHEDERSRAIKACLDRNPNAFRPKIGKDKNLKGERRHNKGCNCKRSGCLKNYCECYEAKIMCSHLCKCVGCKNFEESPDKKTLMHLADAAEVRKLQQVSAKHKLSSQTQDLPQRPTHPSGKRLPYRFVTGDVAEATCSCLIAQAEETERTRQIDTIQERLIIEEFGRCLMQVIESANRTEPGA